MKSTERGQFALAAGRPKVTRVEGSYMSGTQRIAGREQVRYLEPPREEDQIDDLLQGITTADLQGPLAGFMKHHGGAGAGTDVGEKRGPSGIDYELLGLTSPQSDPDTLVADEGTADLLGQPSRRPREEYGDFFEDPYGVEVRDGTGLDDDDDLFDMSAQPAYSREPRRSTPDRPALASRTPAQERSGGLVGLFRRGSR